MRYILFFLLIAIANSAFAAPPEEIKPQISDQAFQGVYFGDFPSVDMVCIRGLCPVGSEEVGINTNSKFFPAYTKQRAITHYHGVRVSSPEYSYFDDKMFMVQFDILCRPNSGQECLDAVRQGLDTEFGLTPYEVYVKGKRVRPGADEVYVTDAGSNIEINLMKKNQQGAVAAVKIYDRTLMIRARKSVNPRYVAPKFVVVKTDNQHEALATDK